MRRACKELEVIFVSRGKLQGKGYFQRAQPAQACLYLMFALFSTFTQDFIPQGGRKFVIWFVFKKKKKKVTIVQIK